MVHRKSNAHSGAPGPPVANSAAVWQPGPDCESNGQPVAISQTGWPRHPPMMWVGRCRWCTASPMHTAAPPGPRSPGRELRRRVAPGTPGTPGIPGIPGIPRHARSAASRFAAAHKPGARTNRGTRVPGIGAVVRHCETARVTLRFHPPAGHRQCSSPQEALQFTPRGTGVPLGFTRIVACKLMLWRCLDHCFTQAERAGVKRGAL